MKGLQQRVQDPPLQLRGKGAVCLPWPWWVPPLGPRSTPEQWQDGWLPQDATGCSLLLAAAS